MEQPKKYKAAVVVIGNEILSGRTLDTNTRWIAEKLQEKGIGLIEVRTIPDDKEKIIEAVNTLRKQVDYLFTTGGIGPTHDDITAQSVAEAFGYELIKNEEAFNTLLDHYGEEEFTPARQKMALIPKGADLIPNPVSAAPGFVLDDVYVMAGVPVIMQAMLEHVVKDLAEGQKVLSNSVGCTIPESEMAPALSDLQDNYPSIEIGSYPHFRLGQTGLNIVLRSTDEPSLKAATQDVIKLIIDKGDEPRSLALQIPVDE